MGHKQQTLANNSLSKKLPVCCEVPQGSVLWPLFFILFINDMQAAVNGANIQMYADDTVIVNSGRCAAEIVDKLQPLLNSFSKWCHANKLSLNASKTKLVIFGTRHKVKKCKGVSVGLEGANLQIVPTYKYLGFMLDSTLSFNHHVNCVSKLVAYKVNLLSKIRRFLNADVALKIYKSMILPYLHYGDVIYGAANASGLEKLQRLQNRGLKICKGYDRRFNTARLHSVTKCSMLKVRREAHLNNFMYQRLDRPEGRDDRNLCTGAHDAPLFKVKIPKLEAYKRAAKYRGAVQWNDLPVKTRLINNFASFKSFQAHMQN